MSNNLMKKELDWKQWEKQYSLAVSSGNKKKTNDLIGFSPTGAAEELAITRQRVHQLVNENKLDLVTIIDRNGNICASFITNNSVSSYKKQYRKPGRKPNLEN